MTDVSTTFRDYLDQRVLVAVFDTDQPQMAVVRALSPKGQYVWLGVVDSDMDANVGWLHVSRVTLLEVFGPSTHTVGEMVATLRAAAEPA